MDEADILGDRKAVISKGRVSSEDPIRLVYYFCNVISMELLIERLAIRDIKASNRLDYPGCWKYLLSSDSIVI